VSLLEKINRDPYSFFGPGIYSSSMNVPSFGSTPRFSPLLPERRGVVSSPSTTSMSSSRRDRDGDAATAAEEAISASSSTLQASSSSHPTSSSSTAIISLCSSLIAASLWLLLWVSREKYGDSTSTPAPRGRLVREDEAIPECVGFGFVRGEGSDKGCGCGGGVPRSLASWGPDNGGSGSERLPLPLPISDRDRRSLSGTLSFPRSPESSTKAAVHEVVGLVNEIVDAVAFDHHC
jgi:hypothetical protein